MLLTFDKKESVDALPAELRSLAEKIGGKTDAADIRNAIRGAGAERISTRNRAAQISETASRINGGLVMREEVCRNGVRELRGDQITELRRFHGVKLRRRAGLPQTFKRGEEKSAVLEDGATHRVAVLVLADIRHCGGEHITRRERAVLVVIR